MAWITFLNGVTDTPDRARASNLDPSKFLDFIGNVEKWASTECATDAEKLAGLGYACVKYRPGAKTKANTEIDPASNTELFVYDVDDMTIAELKRAVLIWRDYDCVIHSTFKHTRERPRLRLLVRLSDPVPNAENEPFKSLYLAGARVLGIKHDPVTLKVANFFLGPQHKPGTNGQAERQRFYGKPLNVGALSNAPHDKPLSVKSDKTDTKIIKPDREAVKKLGEKLAKRTNDAQKIAGRALKRAIKGDALCEVGTVHDTLVKIAFECVRAWRGIDAEWFAEQHLKVACAAVAPGLERWEHRLGDWIKCVETARGKWAETDEKRARVIADGPRALTEAEIAAAEGLKGALIVSFGNSYYVYSPCLAAYTGPFRGAQVPTAFRECLGSMPGVSEFEYKSVNGPPVLKTAAKLNHEYGCTIDAVHYHAVRPPTAYDVNENAIKLQAYKWIDWPAEYSACADDLLRLIGGSKYDLLESYLYKFRDLSQPLPALTLVGPQGTWKSQIAQGLSRFWYNRDNPTPCRAEKVLFRFSAPLLHNPVIWSDERLAAERFESGIPERYRESISERVHMIERKGVDPVILFSATRHVISVNETEKVFSAEIDAASVEATLIRFLVLEIEKSDIEAFEARWNGKRELEALRDGAALVKHIRWIEKNKQHTADGRFWINTASDPAMLWAARFADETLNYCLTICIDNLLNEASHSVPGQISRLPMICDMDGQLRISPDRLNSCWADSDIVAGSSIRKPAPTTIGRYLTKAGFKKYKNERASKNAHKSWAVCHDTLQRFLKVSERCTWSELCEAVRKVFEIEVKN